LSSRAEAVRRPEATWRPVTSWRAEVVAAWAFALRNLQMATRNVFLLFELLFWPVLGVVTIGLMTRFLTFSPEEASFVLIGQMAFSIVGTCQLDVAYSVLYDYWSKSMKHHFLAPIGIRHLTVGSWVVGILRGTLVFSLTSALVWWAFRFNPFAAGVLPVCALLLGCFLTAWIIGVFVCTLIMIFGGRAETSAWASINLVLALAGIYYPVSVLPGWAAAIGAGIPLTYFLDAYRAHFGFTAEYARPFVTGLGLAALYVGLSHWALHAAVNRARRTGLLLKMSE
jgi:ABC-2 type transport system permease protein